MPQVDANFGFNLTKSNIKSLDGEPETRRIDEYTGTL